MFAYSQNDYYCEQVPLADLAHHTGTPAYVYSSQAILENYVAYTQAFGLPHTVCYAVKANSSLAILALLAKAGAGFDIVSGGELYRVLQAGGDPSKVVFSGVGKTAAEVEYALESGIHSFNCESEAELALIDAKASRLGKKAGFSIRVNPDVDAVTHPYISTGLSQHKFGIAIACAAAVYERSRQFPNLVAEGVSCHIGSQILDPSPILEAVDKVLALANQLRGQGHPIRHLDLGGGLGVAYHAGEKSPEIGTFVEMLSSRILASGLTAMIEPGRSIVGPAGVLLTRVLYRKRNGDKEFLIVDAAMNDLIRPSLYRAHHEILPLRKSALPPVTMDVVGPVCETGDFLARDRCMANAMPGDYLAISTAGAYGFVQSSNYNSRPRAPEVMVEGATWRIIRQRENYRTWSAANHIGGMSNPFGTDDMAAGYATSRPPVIRA
jgi:diaminopimelate decarboxylase